MTKALCVFTLWLAATAGSVARASDQVPPTAGGPAVAAPPEDTEAAPQPRALAEIPRAVPAAAPAPGVEEKEWYAGQMAFVYAGSLAFLFSGSVIGSNQGPIAAGVLGLLFVPPILHLGHGNSSIAAASLGVRVLLVATSFTLVSNCFALIGQPPNSGTCDVLGGALIAELLAMPALDFVFARKIVERSGSGLSFVVLPPSRTQSGGISLVGRF